MDNNPKVDIIIPSYNGRYLFEKNLASVLKNTPNLGKLIIIDNGSEDDTVAWLKKHYPKTFIIQNKENLGFTIPVNQGVAESDSDYLILINNDVRPEKNYLDTVFKHFEDKKVFAVTFNEKASSWPKLFWEKGKIQFSRGEDKKRCYYSAWASGGSAIFRRDVWDKVGGLDEIYAPWYWEDIDIGYRAWKYGYKIVWDPKALVIHDHESTSKKLDLSYVNLIKQRNELLFNWLNIKDSKFVLGHLFFLITHSILHPGYLKVILASLIRIIKHKPLKRKFTLSDNEVIKLFSKPI